MKKRTMPAVFALLAAVFIVVMTVLYSFRKALFSLILTLIGIAFPSLPLFHIGKMLKYDINIMKNGEKQTGNCIAYEHGSRSRFGTLVVELEDDTGRTKQLRYPAVRVRFRYPHKITVYKLNDPTVYSNLGVLSIARELLYFLFFFGVWLICTVGTVHYIAEIIKYG